METLARHEAVPRESGPERVALGKLNSALDTFVAGNRLGPERPIDAAIESQGAPTHGQRTVTLPARLLGPVLEKHVNELLVLFEDSSTPPPDPSHGILIHLAAHEGPETRLLVPRA